MRKDLHWTTDHTPLENDQAMRNSPEKALGESLIEADAHGVLVMAYDVHAHELTLRNYSRWDTTDTESGRRLPPWNVSCALSATFKKFSAAGSLSAIRPSLNRRRSRPNDGAQKNPAEAGQVNHLYAIARVALRSLGLSRWVGGGHCHS
jgi:hypothetical protein